MKNGLQKCLFFMQKMSINKLRVTMNENPFLEKKKEQEPDGQVPGFSVLRYKETVHGGISPS